MRTERAPRSGARSGPEPLPSALRARTLQLVATLLGAWATTVLPLSSLRAEAPPSPVGAGIAPLPAAGAPSAVAAAAAITLADPQAALRAFELETFPPPRQPAAGVVVAPPEGAAAARSPSPQGTAHLSSWNPGAGLKTHAAAALDADEALPGTRPPSRALAPLHLPDLPIRWDAKLVRYLEFYRRDPRGRAILGAWLARLGRYAPLIEARLKAHGLPRALIYVAMIESAFDPLRTSPAGAAGLWQFMLSTGRGYGLRRDAWIDERRNPERATDAALRYLKNLHRRLGSWELALAAYNAGFGAVVEAMQKYNTNDYWRLCRYEAGLPWDTTLYVPKILAAAIVDANRAAFGYESIATESALTHELVSVGRSMTLSELARASGGSIEQLRLLNPELRRGRTPPRAGVWVRVPAGTSTRFYAALKRRRPGTPQQVWYEVRLGETLEEIALRHGTTTRALRRLNDLRADAPLRAGLALLVPRAEPAPLTAAPAPGKGAAEAASPAASAAATTPEQAPVVVALPQDVPAALPGRRRVFYRTVLGDGLERVARHLGVTTNELARWNGLDPQARLVSKMILQAFVAPDFSAARVQLLPADRVEVAVAGSEAFLDAHEQRKGRRRQSYTARPGDTLLRVARRFGISVGDLMRINNLGPTAPLLVGQRILVYLSAAQTERRSGSSKPAAAAPVASNARP
ncbi:MAG: transglycosylase SLT domain-containing protein [Proteobacteria bacterium]|nr:transglycosylase SLT domain-containing protein [Pseudomonadota bacterium]